MTDFMIFFANLGIPRPPQLAPLDQAYQLKFNEFSSDGSSSRPDI